jgi:putative glycosyltransferase (TIGR04372 family)
MCSRVGTKPLWAPANQVAKRMSWLGSQLSQVRAGGLPVLDRKVRLALVITVNAIWAIPCILVIRFIRPWLHVRIGALNSARSGHFIGDAALYLADKFGQSNSPRTVYLFWFPEPTCNEQWARMVRRQLFVRWWVRYLIIFNKLIPGGFANHLPSTNGTRDIYGALPKSRVRFEFNAFENDVAKTWLRRRGWQEGEAFVCLLVRDPAYLASQSARFGENGEKWRYHNYRDSDINNYVEATKALLEKGYWVIRMGKTALSHFPLHHSKIIDYPFVTDQDDLLDIWLSSNCFLFITTGTGIDMVPTVYQRPVAFVNLNPLGRICSYAVGITVPKHLRWKNNRRPLTLLEHLGANYLDTSEYERAGIEIEDLAPTEITAAVMEYEQRLKGTWIETADSRNRQARFWEVFRSWPDFGRFHSYIHPEARIGCSWLESMGNSFVD